MNSFSQLSVLVAAVCPLAWIMSLFYGANGKPTVPGYDQPSAGFGLLALFSLVQVTIVAVISVMALRLEELREVSTIFLVAALATMMCLSLFSYVFAKSPFAVRGVWHGLVGILALGVGQVVN